MATLLRLRRLEERRAEQAVAEVTRRLDAARQELAARRQVRDRAAAGADTTDVVRLRALHLSGIRAQELVTMALEEQDRSERELTAARARWAASSTRRKTAERLDERRRFEVEAAAITAAHRALDELVSLRHTGRITRGGNP